MMTMHPGDFLLERVLLPSDMSIRQAAQRLGMPADSLAALVAGKVSMTGSVARALSQEFSYSERWWLGLQASWDSTANPIV